MNIKLNGNDHAVPADASVSTLVTAMTGRVLDPADRRPTAESWASPSHVIPRWCRAANGP